MSWRRWVRFFRKREEAPEEEPVSTCTFLQYTELAPQILTWMRREKGIAKKDLELAVVDDGEQPAWKVARVLEFLERDLNLLYILTDREEAFRDLAREAYEEKGLLVMLRGMPEDEKLPGNLALDLREWENHLDIISEVSYNTVTI